MATTSNVAMASQADYQSEIGYEFQQVDYGNTVNTKDIQHTISFEYFLEPVIINDQPLAEAAFMNRISSFAVGHGQFDTDSDNRTGKGNDNAFLYTHMQQGSALLFQILYARQTADYDFISSSYIDFSYDRTLTGISLGSFVAKNTAIDLTYSQDKVEFLPAVYSTQLDYTLTQTHIEAKHLMPIDNSHMVNIEATIGTDSYDNKGSANTKNTLVEVKGEYYLNNRQSIGGTLEKISGDDNGYKGQAIAVHGKFFITSKFSLAAKFRQFSGDKPNTDYDTITINANMRF